jgi:hypothetical protein
MPTSSVMANTVYLGEAVPNDQTIPEAPRAPTVTQVASGSQALRTERVMITNVSVYGESAPSPEVVLQVAANNVILVSPPVELKFTGDYPGKSYAFNVYATTGATNTETKQNTTSIINNLTATWQEPPTGLIAGAALPTAVAPNPGLVASTNLTNAAPPTGNLAPVTSPLGVANTNTGRTSEATATYMTASLNALNVGTTPPPTGILKH